MPAYIVPAQLSSTATAGQKQSILAVSFPLKIISVDLFTQTTVDINRITGASVSGGTAVTPSPMRELPGVQAATATARNLPTSVTGTSVLLLRTITSFTPKTELYINVGSAFTVTLVSINSTATFAIYFEEVHLARTA